jgi:hypothetical protein
MEYLILAVFSFYIGYKVAELVSVASFKKILEDLDVKEDQLRELVKKNGMELEDDSDSEPAKDQRTVVEIKVEEVHGCLYAYEAAKDTFIAQGRDGDELVQRLLQALPVNTRIICDRDNGGDLITNAVEKLAEKKV